MLELCHWQEKLRLIPAEIWGQSVAHENLYRGREFWHLKYYKTGIKTDGFEPHKFVLPDNTQVDEIPYARRFFYSSKQRFSLKEKPVAYFAREWAVATCETDPSFRDAPPNSNAEFWERLKSLEKPKAGDPYGYPENRLINISAPILNLTRTDTSIIQAFIKHGLCESETEIMNDLIQCKDDFVYPITWEIAEVAYDNDLKGIIYSSARAPQGFLDHVIVLFDESLIELPEYLKTK